jgi:hypothetical protein
VSERRTVTIYMNAGTSELNLEDEILSPVLLPHKNAGLAS